MHWIWEFGYYELFCFSGVLQNCGVNSEKGKSDISLFSKLICDTSSNIILLIDSLPTVSVDYLLKLNL